MRPLFESPLRPLLKSDIAPARKPDTRLRWPGEGPLFESDLMNAQGALLESSLGPLARYSTHQETMSGRLEQVYLPSDSRLDLPEEGPLFELDFKKWWEGGNMDTIPVTPWAIIYIRPGPLVRYGTGANYYQMWLNIVIKFF